MSATTDDRRVAVVTGANRGIGREVVRQLAEDGYTVSRWPSYTAYVISFLLIGLVWANHHTMFEHIRRGDRVLLFFNTLLLMDVALLPFVTSVVALALRTGGGQRPAVLLYGGTLVVGGVFFNAVWAWACHRRELLDPDLSSADARRISRGFRAGPLLYLIGTLLGAVIPLAGLLVFAGLILVYWLPVTRLTPGRARVGTDRSASSRGRVINTGVELWAA